MTSDHSPFPRGKLLICGNIPDYPDDISQFDEVWGVNTVYARFPRGTISRLFYFDNWLLFDEKFPERAKELHEDGCRIITRWPDPEIPGTEAYPLDAIIGMFGFAYFPCTFAYMLALASMELWSSVTIAGCYHAGDSWEYVQHKASVEFWIGTLMGTGSRVQVHGDSMLLNTMPWESEVYGYETNELRRLPIDTLAGAYTACSMYPLKVQIARPPEGHPTPRYVSRWKRDSEKLPVINEVLT